MDREEREKKNNPKQHWKGRKTRYNEYEMQKRESRIERNKEITKANF